MNALFPPTLMCFVACCCSFMHCLPLHAVSGGGIRHIILGHNNHIRERPTPPTPSVCCAVFWALLYPAAFLKLHYFAAASSSCMHTSSIAAYIYAYRAVQQSQWHKQSSNARFKVLMNEFTLSLNQSLGVGCGSNPSAHCFHISIAAC